MHKAPTYGHVLSILRTAVGQEHHLPDGCSAFILRQIDKKINTEAHKRRRKRPQNKFRGLAKHIVSPRNSSQS